MLESAGLPLRRRLVTGSEFMILPGRGVTGCMHFIVDERVRVNVAGLMDELGFVLCYCQAWLLE
jgi:hypothetical protein